MNLSAHELIERRCREHDLSRQRLHRAIVFIGSVSLIGLFFI